MREGERKIQSLVGTESIASKRLTFPFSIVVEAAALGFMQQLTSLNCERKIVA